MRSLDAAVIATQPGARTAGDSWRGGRELANKVRAYTLVRWRGELPRVRHGDRWADLVAAAQRCAPFAVLFRLERLARDLTHATCRQVGEPTGLLCGPDTAALPESCLLMLHAGMGMAFCERTVGSLPRGAGEAAVAAALGHFAVLCRDNARPGYEQPTWEPLGAVVRLFHARRTAAVGRALASHDADQRLCFWHGVGRGHYFLPRYFWPGATPLALARCRREPPTSEARADALAGFVFAAAMANLRHAPVLETLVAALGDVAAEEAVVAGAVAACVTTRHHTTPHDPAVAALLAHEPAPARAALWQRRVRAPVAAALEVQRSATASSGRLPRLGRHRDLRRPQVSPA